MREPRRDLRDHSPITGRRKRLPDLELAPEDCLLLEAIEQFSWERARISASAGDDSQPAGLYLTDSFRWIAVAVGSAAVWWLGIDPGPTRARLAAAPSKCVVALDVRVITEQRKQQRRYTSAGPERRARPQELAAEPATATFPSVAAQPRTSRSTSACIMGSAGWIVLLRRARARRERSPRHRHDGIRTAERSPSGRQHHFHRPSVLRDDERPTLPPNDLRCSPSQVPTRLLDSSAPRARQTRTSHRTLAWIPYRTCRHFSTPSRSEMNTPAPGCHPHVLPLPVSLNERLGRSVIGSRSRCCPPSS